MNSSIAALSGIASLVWLAAVAAAGEAPTMKEATAHPNPADAVLVRGEMIGEVLAGKKRTTKAGYETSVAGPKYLARISETVGNHDRTIQIVSDRKNVYTGIFLVANRENPDFTPIAMGEIRAGRIPSLGSLESGQFLASALLLAEETPAHGEVPPDLVPQFVANRAKIENATIKSQVASREDHGAIKIKFWGLQPGADAERLENSEACFLIGSLEIREPAPNAPWATLDIFKKDKAPLSKVWRSVPIARYELRVLVGNAAPADLLHDRSVTEHFKNKPVWLKDYRAASGSEKPYKMIQMPADGFIPLGL